MDMCSDVNTISILDHNLNFAAKLLYKITPIHSVKSLVHFKSIKTQIKLSKTNERQIKTLNIKGVEIKILATNCSQTSCFLRPIYSDVIVTI